MLCGILWDFLVIRWYFVGNLWDYVAFCRNLWKLCGLLWKFVEVMGSL